MTISGSKRCLWNVTVPYSELVITRSKINFGEVTCTLELIKQIIDPWNWLLILNGDLIQLSIINEHTKRTILLSNKQHRSTPQ